MMERRRRLLKYMYKKDGKVQLFEAEYLLQIKGKQEVTSKFSSLQLEELLLNSTKSVA